MKEYQRRPDGMAETAAEAVTEVVVGGNRAALKSRAPEVSLCCPSSKRRKVSSRCGNNDGDDEVASDNSDSLAATSAAVVCEAVTSKCSSCESSESVKEDLRNIDLKAKKVKLQHLCLHLLFSSLLFQISSVSHHVLIARN